MRIEDLLDLGSNGFALPQHGFQAVGQAGQHGVGCGGTGDGDGLLVQGGPDGGDELVAHAGRVLSSDRGELAAAGLADPGGAAAAGQDLQHRRVGNLRTQDAL